MMKGFPFSSRVRLLLNKALIACETLSNRESEIKESKPGKTSLALRFTTKNSLLGVELGGDDLY